MKKQLKITIIAVSVVIAVLGLGFLGVKLFGYKGQSVESLKETDSGQSQTIEYNEKPISECTPLECLYILSGKMNKFNYHATVLGQVNTSFGSVSKQTVEGEKYFYGGRALYKTKSTSTLVKVGKKIYIESDNTVNVFEQRDFKNDTFYDTPTHYDNFDLFLQEYGVDTRNLCNYTLNDQTILSARQIQTTDGTYKFEYIVSPENATVGYKINMVKMGGLTSAPEFSYCKLTVVMTEDFMPVSVNTYDEYKVSYFGIAVNCVSDITTTFDLIGEEIIIP